MFETTPQDLINDGLYSALALAAYPGCFWPVSLALVARALGAVDVGGICAGGLCSASFTTEHRHRRSAKAHKMQMSLAAKMIADAEARSLCWSARLDQNVDQCSLKGSPSGTSPSGRSSRNSPSYSPSKRRAFNGRASSSSGGRSTASETSCRDTTHSSCRDTTPAYLQCTPRGDTPPDVWLAPCELSAAAAAEAASGTTVNVHAKLEAKCCSPAERAPCSSSSSFVAPGACQQSRVHALPSHTAEGQKAKDHITVRV